MVKGSYPLNYDRQGLFFFSFQNLAGILKTLLKIKKFTSKSSVYNRNFKNKWLLDGD